MTDYIRSRFLNLLTNSLGPIPQELNELDWKIGLSSRPEQYKKHISAFANLADGGFIVFGISDKDGSVVGINEKETKKIASQISNIARDGVEPKVKTDFFSLKFKDKNLFVCHIFECIEKPVYVLNNGKLESPFIRAGGNSHPMHRDEIRSAILNSRQIKISYEEVPAFINSNIDDNWDWNKFFDFSQIQQRLKRTAFTSDQALKEFLFNLKLATKINGKYAPTNLAIISCAKDFGLFPNFEKLEIRILVYRGTNKLDSIKNLSFKKGYSLCLDDVLDSITSLLPHNEIIHQATRHHVPMIPAIALREIIVNAIVHRDYTKNYSHLMIEIYEGRVEITNPGNLLPELEIDRLIDHPSKTRNEVLADFMRQLGFSEERGSGIDKAIFSCELAGLPPIKFLNGNDYFKVTLYGPKQYSQMERSERIEAVYQHCCLNYVMTQKTTNKTIRDRFKFNEKETTKSTRIIKDSIESKKIKLANPESIKKNYFYIPYWA